MSHHDDAVPEASPGEAFAALKEGQSARLIDVRTRAEWAFVGIPDLSGTDSDLVLVEWQEFPSMAVDTDFASKVESQCPDKNTSLYFLCRSGARSLAAAKVMKMHGYASVYNVTDGFEGPPNAEGHRGSVAGWKSDNLPWRQN
ncbi:MAG: rhodanese-like domain-containing protein [Pseudomonadota bacterium]